MQYLKVIMIATALAATLYGILLIVIPVELGLIFAPALQSKMGIFIMQCYGAMHLGFAALNWFGSKLKHSDGLEIILFYNFFCAFITGILSLYAQLSGVFTQNGWHVVLFDWSFALCFGYYYIQLRHKLHEN